MNFSRRQFLSQVSYRVAGGFTLALAHLPRTMGQELGKRPEMLTVRDLGFQFRNNDINVTGKDGSTSIPLPDGTSFWTFGDTMEGPFDSIRDHDLTDVIPNTACIVPLQDAWQGITKFTDLSTEDGKRPRQLIHFSEAEDKSKQRLWAIDGICVGNHIYLYYHKITIQPGKSVFVSFDLNGMGLAKAKIGEFRFTRVRAVDGSHELWKGDVPGYGVCVQQLDDGFVYLWGSLMTGMYLARTRPEHIEDVSRHEYLVACPTPNNPQVKAKWGTAFEPQAALFDSVPNEMSVSYNTYLKKYLAIHMFNTENRIVMRTADSITGPWSEATDVFRPEKHDPIMSFYAAKEHPELAKDGGRTIYITFVDSVVYMPRLIEVTFAGA